MADCSSRSWMKFDRSVVKCLRTGTEMERSFAVVFHGHSSLVAWMATVAAVVALLTAIALPWTHLLLSPSKTTNGEPAGNSFQRQNSPHPIIAKRNRPNHISNLFSSSPASDFRPTLFSGYSDSALNGPEISLISTIYFKPKDRTTGGMLTEINKICLKYG